MYTKKLCLDRSDLKNRDFGKEAPQNFDSERATIAERQGASENRNSEEKPTQPKTDSSGCFGLDLVDTGAAEAEANMSKDAELLKNLQPEAKPILHFYDWTGPSATYGHFIDLKKHIRLDQAQFHRLSLAKRPTGGGIVFHIWDLAFSFLMPAMHPACSKNTLDNYRFVNEVVLEAAIESLGLINDGSGPSLIDDHAPLLGPNCNHFCMARPTIYDVVYRGLKIAGAAQRRTKNGYLHQGTISLGFPHLSLLKSVLLSQEEVSRAMETYSFAPLGRLWTPFLLKEARLKLREVLLQKFLTKLGT